MNRVKIILKYLPRQLNTRTYSMASNNQKIWKEVSLPVPWGKIRGKWWGPTNIRPILALHGWQDNAATYDTLIPLLNKDISFLAIDLPGHGHSSWLPPGGFYIPITYFITIKYIMHNLNWPKVSLMGHSLGGITCSSYTVLFPNEVDYLICLDGLKPLIPLPGRNNRAKKVVDLIKNYENSKSSKEPPSYTMEEILGRINVASYQSITKESAKYLIERNIAPSKIHPGKYYITRDPRLRVIEYNEIPQEEIVSQTENIKCPVFITKATGADYFETKQNFYDVVDVLKRTSADFVFHFVDGTHHSHLNNPENTARFLNDFIVKHNDGDRRQGGLKEEFIVYDDNVERKHNFQARL